MLDVYSATLTYSLTILLALRRYAGACVYVGMLSRSRAHAVMVACAYAHKHMRVFHIFGRAKFLIVFLSIFVRGRILSAVLRVRCCVEI